MGKSTGKLLGLSSLHQPGRAHQYSSFSVSAILTFGWLYGYEDLYRGEFMLSELTAARFVLLALTLFSYAGMAGLASVAGLRIDYASFVQPCGYFLCMLVFFGGYCHFRGLRALGFVMETFFCLLLLIAPIFVSTYVAMRLDMPLADDVLMHWDGMLGIDWLSFILFVDNHPFLTELLGLSYQSFQYQLLVLPAFLIVVGRVLRAYHMVIAYALICFASSLVSVWFPALGTYAVYGLKETDVANINAYFGYFFLEQFHAVRGDPNFILSLPDAAGILTFPSVHAAIAALCAWAGWGFKPVRYPMLVLNILMATSAVTHGSHYVVDVIAGIAIAFAIIFFVKWLTGRVPARRPANLSALSPA